MSALSTQLTAGALGQYANHILDLLEAGPANAAALAADIEAFDELDATQQPRFAQIMDYFLQVRGRNLSHGQVASLTVSTPGTGYAVGDKIGVTSATGTGALAQVTTLTSPAGEIAAVELIHAGSNYLVTDTATVITTAGGSGGVITATVDTNNVVMFDDAAALLAA